MVGSSVMNLAGSSERATAVLMVVWKDVWKVASTVGLLDDHLVEW